MQCFALTQVVLSSICIPRQNLCPEFCQISLQKSPCWGHKSGVWGILRSRVALLSSPWVSLTADARLVWVITLEILGNGESDKLTN